MFNNSGQYSRTKGFIINLLEKLGTISQIVEIATVNGVVIENSSTINNIVNASISTKTLVNGITTFPISSNLAFTLTFSNVFLVNYRLVV